MDTPLKCNDLDCRTPVPDQAIVTTCSHIFCLKCANLRGLVEGRDGNRQCPACHTALNNPDDAVVTSLNPTEDYKTSLLSGLSPTIIMECTSRGLQFWAYQMVQEITYQAYMARSLTERYTALAGQMDSISRQTGEENASLRARLEAMHEENRNLIETNHKIESAYKDKARAQQQYLTLYNKLKSKQMAAGIEVAADIDAENVLMHASTQQQQRNTTDYRTRDLPGRGQGSNDSGSTEGRRRRRRLWPGNPVDTSQTFQASQGTGNGLSNSQTMPLGTPSQNRVRLPNLPQPAFGSYNSNLFGGTGSTGIGAGGLRGAKPVNRPYSHNYGQGGQVAGRSPTSYGPGLSAGMRMGRQPQAHFPLSRAGPVPSRSGNYGGMGVR